MTRVYTAFGLWTLVHVGFKYVWGPLALCVEAEMLFSSWLKSADLQTNGHASSALPFRCLDMT